jgi:alkylation response protein AidB-like acyl-CoA dehydrogenase
MDMKLSPEQLKLRSAARELAEAEFAARAAEIDRTEAYPFGNVAALKAAGFMGYTIPKSYGGRGGSYFEAALIIEEMARVCGATGRITVEANMGAISAVMQYGTEKQKRLGADLVLSGDKPAICITEPEAGSAATEMTTRADKRGNTYVIRGKKHWITGGGVSKLHLIFARVFDERGAEQGIGGFLALGGDARSDHRQTRTRHGSPRHPRNGDHLREPGNPRGYAGAAAARAAARICGSHRRL